MPRCLLVVLLLVSTPLLAEPFLLSEPSIAALGFSPIGISIGASPDRFLLSGLASHSPVVLPISANGEPQILRHRILDIGNASSIGEPVWVNDRWIVVVNPDFLNPNRVLLTEVGTDGTLLREPRIIETPQPSSATAAWNGRSLLVTTGRRVGISDIEIRVRTATPDLDSISEETTIAPIARRFRAAPTAEGFLVVWVTDGVIHAVRLSDDGTMIGSPLLLGSMNANVPIEIADGPEGTLVLWVDGAARLWNVHGTRIFGDQLESIGEMASIEGDTSRVLLRRLDSGFAAIWQGIDFGGARQGKEIHWRLLDATGKWVGEPNTTPDLVGGEVLEAAGSNGRSVIVAWTRSIFAVGTPMWGAILSAEGFAPAKLLSIDYRFAKKLELTSAGDGTAVAAWIESSGTGESLFVGRWDRDGNRLALRDVRPVAGVFGEIALAVGGGRILLLWQEGQAILGAMIDPDATLAGEPFVVTPKSGKNPAAAWDGRRFVATWIASGGIAAAFVSADGDLSHLGIVASPPPPRYPDSGFGFQSARIAAGADGTLIAAVISEGFFCVGIPCPIQTLVGFARFDANGVPVGPHAEILDYGSQIDVATDGRDFLLVWRGEDGVRSRVIRSAGGVQPPSRLQFGGIGADPAVTWNGLEYVAAWGFDVNGISRIASARIDRNGERVAALFGIEAPERGLRVTGFSGDALAGWIEHIPFGSGSATVVRGEFLRNAIELPATPSAPASVTISGSATSLELAWSTVPGADAWLIEIIGYFIGPLRQVRVETLPGDATSADLTIYKADEIVRLRALGAGGPSDPFEIRLHPPRTRAVRRAK